MQNMHRCFLHSATQISCLREPMVMHFSQNYCTWMDEGVFASMLTSWCQKRPSLPHRSPAQLSSAQLSAITGSMGGEGLSSAAISQLTLSLHWSNLPWAMWASFTIYLRILWSVCSVTFQMLLANIRKCMHFSQYAHWRSFRRFNKICSLLTMSANRL